MYNLQLRSIIILLSERTWTPLEYPQTFLGHLITFNNVNMLNGFYKILLFERIWTP